jgi:hypothetical protein
MIQTATLIVQLLILAVVVAVAAVLIHDGGLSRPDAHVGEKWQYEIIDCDKETLADGVKTEDDAPVRFHISQKKLNDLGFDGWELCGVYPEVETVFPKDIISGAIIGPNVRPHELMLLFKKRLPSTDIKPFSVD